MSGQRNKTSKKCRVPTSKLLVAYMHLWNRNTGKFLWTSVMLCWTLSWLTLWATRLWPILDQGVSWLTLTGTWATSTSVRSSKYVYPRVNGIDWSDEISKSPRFSGDSELLVGTQNCSSSGRWHLEIHSKFHHTDWPRSQFNWLIGRASRLDAQSSSSRRLDLVASSRSSKYVVYMFDCSPIHILNVACHDRKGEAAGLESRGNLVAWRRALCWLSSLVSRLVQWRGGSEFRVNRQ